jgi:hypothetical protein
MMERDRLIGALKANRDRLKALEGSGRLEKGMNDYAIIDLGIEDLEMILRALGHLDGSTVIDLESVGMSRDRALKGTGKGQKRRSRHDPHDVQNFVVRRRRHSGRDHGKAFASP